MADAILSFLRFCQSACYATPLPETQKAQSTFVELGFYAQVIPPGIHPKLETYYL